MGHGSRVPQAGRARWPSYGRDRRARGTRAGRRRRVPSAEDQELLAADPVGVAGHHGVEQVLIGQPCLAELPVVFEVAPGLGQDRGQESASHSSRAMMAPALPPVSQSQRSASSVPASRARNSSRARVSSPVTTSARPSPARTASISRSSTSRSLRRPVSPVARPRTGECLAICPAPASSGTTSLRMSAGVPLNCPSR
jgi:hypothetical protein